MPWHRLLVIVVLTVAAALAATQWRRLEAETPGWIGQTADGPGGFSLHYEILLPADFKPTTHYPVLLYLHQLDMGNDRDRLIRQVDAWFGTAEFRARHPAIVVVPTLDQTQDIGGRVINFGGKRDGHLGEEATIAALKQVMARYPVDPARIYVTGNSMGGMGTWELLLTCNTRTCSRERIFAAGLPLAGRHATADPKDAAETLRQVPIWAIHGGRDPEVSPAWDRTMAGLLAGSSTFRYTEDPQAGHDVWDRTYIRPDVWDWLFAQRSGT